MSIQRVLGVLSLLICAATSRSLAERDSSKQPCSEAVVALAAGIFLNIRGQYAEYNGTMNVINVESTIPVNYERFLIAKGELISDIQGGLNIRLFNQEIAPAGNPAIPGITKYAAAQQTEFAIAKALTGNPEVDLPNLNDLKSDIMTGIALNQANLKAATSECDFTLQFPPPNQSGS